MALIQLRILGSPSLEDGNGGKATLLLSRPKRLALLAYLAATTNGTLARRDAVLGLFWPDEPEEKARHALNQSLHILRRFLGPGALVTKGEGIGVDPHYLWCDAAAFREALERGDHESALSLYRGKLLEGFFAAECGEFERWVEDVRVDLHERAALAAGASAEAAAARGDPSALRWARRACELAPYDEGSARRLMSLLELAGDRSGALATYQRLAGRLHTDLELAPSVETQRLAGALRSTPPSNGSTPTVLEAPTSPAVPASSPTRSVRVPRAFVLGTAALLLAILAWSLRPVPVKSTAGLLRTGEAVAVFPFDVEGDAVAAPSAREIVELLGTRLDGAGKLRALPASSVLRLAGATSRLEAGGRQRMADRLGATSYVEGGLTIAGGRLHFRASWRRSDRREMAAATAEGEVGRLFEVLDTLAIRLLAGSFSEPRDRLARVAAGNSPSLASLKTYLEGEAALAEGRFDRAARAFERAAADSGFALAQFRFGQAALWTSDYPLAALDAGARALRHAGALPNRERRLLAAFDAWRTGDAYNAEQLPRTLIAADPDDLDAWFAFGESRFHYNPLLGRESTESRDAFEQVIRLDPNHWMAHWHLALLAALEGRLPDLDRRVRLLEQLGPDTDYRAELAAVQTCAHRDTTRLPRVLDSLRSLGQGRLTDIVWRCAVYGRNLEAAEAMARLFLVPGELAYAENVGHEQLATLAMARGHYREALAQLDSLSVVGPGSTLLHRTLFATLPLAPQPTAKLLSLLEEWQAKSRAPNGWWDTPAWKLTRSQMLGFLMIALGRTDQALSFADEHQRLARFSSEPDLVQAEAEGIRGSVSTRLNRPLEALRHFESVNPVTWFGYRVSSAVSGGFTRFTQAQALEQAGRLEDASHWYAGLGQFSTFDLVYAPLGYYQLGKLLEQRKQPAAATAAYSRFIESWETADPEYQPLVQTAKQRRASLTRSR